MAKMRSECSTMHNQAPANTTKHVCARRSPMAHDMEHASPNQDTIAPTPTTWGTNACTKTPCTKGHQGRMQRDRINQSNMQKTTCKQHAPHKYHKHQQTTHEALQPQQKIHTSTHDHAKPEGIQNTPPSTTKHIQARTSTQEPKGTRHETHLPQADRQCTTTNNRGH